MSGQPAIIGAAEIGNCACAKLIDLFLLLSFYLIYRLNFFVGNRFPLVLPLFSVLYQNQRH